ncbi:MAG: hypothetical protein PHE76_01345 [Candidatus Pacebacteria bacterium]|jgi:hypothetical protein|nr:hypothetical protein [Candidatus Paceibacterota bacterium]MDD3047901.1 hypothetical protein [Candidatus Paceibacterota bacterium]MDD3509959.1 hypothetical protein [Candidatus Paceibacterota bacterium]MDD3918524.1 hypothetical protein [Candidatus Paceibacterota bacterium]MDD4664562.1 hypothetical protein [Candidatus Paceibacterota bacterium]
MEEDKFDDFGEIIGNETPEISEDELREFEEIMQNLKNKRNRELGGSL